MIFDYYGEERHLSLDQFKPREVTRWLQLSVEEGIPQALVETLDFAKPIILPWDLYSH